MEIFIVKATELNKEKIIEEVVILGAFSKFEDACTFTDWRAPYDYDFTGYKYVNKETKEYIAEYEKLLDPEDIYGYKGTYTRYRLEIKPTKLDGKEFESEIEGVAALYDQWDSEI